MHILLSPFTEAPNLFLLKIINAQNQIKLELLTSNVKLLEIFQRFLHISLQVTITSNNMIKTSMHINEKQPQTTMLLYPAKQDGIFSNGRPCQRRRS